MSKNNTEFEWYATESAPKHYPMEIIKGTFYYRGESERGLYIPDGGTLKAGWGDPISDHAVGPDHKPLPDRIKIIFFSYPEKQFYKGEFDLPYDTILSLFREGAGRDKDNPLYSRIMAGIAPGGAVAIWVTGGERTVEVFFGQAQKVDLDPGRAFALPFESKEESDRYIREVLEESITPEELASLKRDGIPFGLWSRYRNRYDWAITLSEGYTTEKARVIFVNGEHIRAWRQDDPKEAALHHPVPKEIGFQTKLNGQGVIFIVHFDEQETMAAFEKLGANGQKVYLELEPRWPRTQLRARLHNGKESIELKKIVRENW